VRILALRDSRVCTLLFPSGAGRRVSMVNDVRVMGNTQQAF